MIFVLTDDGKATRALAGGRSHHQRAAAFSGI
jgi:hypothetical protein